MIAELPLPDSMFGQIFQMTNYLFGAFFMSIFLGQVDLAYLLFYLLNFECAVLFWCSTVSFVSSILLNLYFLYLFS